MKLRKALAGLGLITVLLAGGTCYAENKENPIIADTANGYIRMDLPYVKKVEYYGRSYVQCAYSYHSYVILPYGIPVSNYNGTEYVWFDPAKNKVTWFKWAVPSDEATGMSPKCFADITGDALTVYNSLKNMFPDLCNEVIAANQATDAKYGNDIAQAEAAYDSGDWEEIYASLKKLYDDGLRDSVMFRDLERACWNLGNYDEALAWDTKRIEINPSSKVYNQRAWHYYLLGKYDLALTDARNAVMKDDTNSNILDTRGTIYYALGQYDKAIADFDKGLKLNKELAHSLFYRAKCYEALGQQDKAKSDYKKARKYDPNIIEDDVKFENTRRQHENAKKQRADAAKAAEQRVSAIQNKMEASAASLRNEGFIKVVVDKITYEAKSYDNALVYKTVVNYMDWYIDPANIHYSVGSGKWAGTERYDVLVASVTESGSVHKLWYVYLHDKEGNWAHFQMETNDSPLGRSFDDVGSYAIMNFGFAPGQEARSRAGVKYGDISAVMQSVLNYRNGANMALIHSNSDRMVEYLSPAEFNALPFPEESAWVEVH